MSTGIAQVVKVVSEQELRIALARSAAREVRRVGNIVVFKTPSDTYVKVEPMGAGRFRTTMTKGRCDC